MGKKTVDILLKDYGFPALFAVLSAVVLAYQQHGFTSFHQLAIVAGGAAMAFVLTLFNPKAGAAEPWLIPPTQQTPEPVAETETVVTPTIPVVPLPATPAVPVNTTARIAAPPDDPSPPKTT